MKSLLEQLPSIVAEGKKEAERVIERAESNYRLGLQTRELVVPSKDTNWQDLLRNAQKSSTTYQEAPSNQLIYGDNLLAMAVLLAGDSNEFSRRGGVDLIYIDQIADNQ